MLNEYLASFISLCLWALRWLLIGVPLEATESPKTAALCSSDRSCVEKRSRAFFQLEKPLKTKAAYESFSRDVVGRGIGTVIP